MADTVWPRLHAVSDEDVTAEAAAVADRAAEALVPGRMPAVYLGHGAPPLLDDRCGWPNWQPGRGRCRGRAPC